VHTPLQLGTIEPCAEGSWSSVHAPRGSACHSDEARRSRPGLFVEEEVDTTTWASVKVFQTKRADAVVLLGGAGIRNRPD
jgi:hypothetical protein